MSPLDLLEAALGLFVLAFLPGWVWSIGLRDRLSQLERGLVAVVISVAVVVVLVYAANAFLGVPVRGTTAIWLALGATAGGLAPRAYAWLARGAGRVDTL